MSVIAALEALPADGLTVTALRSLDSVVPGEWQNVISFDAMIAEAAGTDRPGVISVVRQRALAMEAAPGARYDQALQVFGLADRVDQLAAGAALANKVGDMFGSLGFLKKFTPKPDTTQTLDAGLKLVAELLAFGLVNGMPTTGPDGLARYAGALADYAGPDLMRISAWVVFDGLLPLGPDFLAKILDGFQGAAGAALQQNQAFSALAGHLPGESVDDKKAFIVSAIDTTGDWVTRFVEQNGLTQDVALGQLKGVLGVADGGLDYVAAALDASTNYMAHTGTQTVARGLARGAVSELKGEVWQKWLASA